MTQIVGLQKRVGNGSIDEIKALWAEFFTQGHDAKIQGDTHQLYAVMSNYSDGIPAEKTYDLLIGYEGEAQDGYNVIELADTQYQQYFTQGTGAQVIVDAWTKVWNDDLNRAYQTDYEVYSGDMSFPDITLYVGIKS